MSRLKYAFLTIFMCLLIVSCTKEKNPGSEFTLDENQINKERAERAERIKNSLLSQGKQIKTAKFFAASDDYILPAILDRSATPKKINIIDPETLKETSAENIGRFSIYFNDNEYRLPAFEVIDESSKIKYIYIFFKDKTSGKESSQSGRYLKIIEDDADEDEYVLDFNLAFCPSSVLIGANYSAPEATTIPILLKAGETTQ